MSAITGPAPHDRATARAWPGLATGAAILGAAILTFVMFSGRFTAVWQHGAFYDPDDAMRLAEVRALLGGQGWFDMTAYGLDPPAGTFMHWSHTIDLPLAALVKALSLVTGPATAETGMRLIVPFVLLLALFYGVARLGNGLAGPAARIPAIAAALFCGGAIIQFQPGRIAHHAPQVLALLFMTIAALEALDPAKARRVAWAGLLTGFSLSVNLEDLPFIACLYAGLVCVWVAQGRAAAALLRFAGLGLAAGLVPFFAVTVGPGHWFDPVCDAFGVAHLAAGLSGAMGCLVLAAASRLLQGRFARLAAACGIGLLSAGLATLVTPACLHDPFAGVAPLVRDIWLSNVTESRSLARFFRDDWQGAVLTVVPVALGLCGTLAATVTSRGLAAWRFGLLSALIAMGLVAGSWQIRVFTSVTPLAIAGALPLAVLLYHRAKASGRDAAAILALCLVFPFTSAAWALLLPEDGSAAPSRASHQCLAPESFSPFATVPPGRLVAPVDSGSYFLVHTAMTVFAGPYHRDNPGNLLALESMMAAPDAAHAMLKARGANYVAICPGFGETGLLAKRAPDGLASALLGGRIPAWLIQVPLHGSPYLLFKIL